MVEVFADVAIVTAWLSGLGGLILFLHRRRGRMGRGDMTLGVMVAIVWIVLPVCGGRVVEVMRLLLILAMCGSIFSLFVWGINRLRKRTRAGLIALNTAVAFSGAFWIGFSTQYQWRIFAVFGLLVALGVGLVVVARGAGPNFVRLGRDVLRERATAYLCLILPVFAFAYGEEVGRFALSSYLSANLSEIQKVAESLNDNNQVGEWNGIPARWKEGRVNFYLSGYPVFPLRGTSLTWDPNQNSLTEKGKQGAVEISDDDPLRSITGEVESGWYIISY